MTVPNEDILDPAHQDDGGITHVGAAGTGVEKPEDKLELSEDGNQVKRGDKTYIREEALHQARAEAAQLKQTLKQLEPLMPEFNEFITAKQSRRDSTVQRAAAEDSEYSEDELDGYAIATGMYEQDGVTPDRRRAEAALGVVARVADRRAGRKFDPLAREFGADRANRNTESARSRQFVDGEPIAEQRYLDATIEALPPGMMADPTIANLSNVIAAGLEYLDKRKSGTLKKGRAGREPMFVEGGSRGADHDTSDLSPLDLAAARARGKTPEQWMKMTRSAAPKQRVRTDSNILEEV